MKKGLMYMLLLTIVAVIGSMFEFSVMFFLVLLGGVFFWCIYNIEKTYNANFDALDMKNQELTIKMFEYEMEIDDLKKELRILRRDVDNIL